MLKHLLALILLISPFYASANTSLESALDALQTLHARFLQIDRTPNNPDLKTTQGEIWVKVPGKFRWQNEGGEDSDEQTIVADGEKLWLHDISLAQVSVYKQEEALVNSPAIILSNPKEIRKHFEIQEGNTQSDEHNYTLFPKQANHLFIQIDLIILDNKISELSMTNQDGTQTQFNLFYESYNQPISNKTFEFELPNNIDLIQ